MKLLQELNKLHTVPSQEVMVHLVCLSITVIFVCICAVICKTLKKINTFPLLVYSGEQSWAGPEHGACRVSGSRGRRRDS